MKVAIYCRVSTRDKGQETANQRLQLERFARKQGWKIVAVYEDRVSGKRGENGREAFKSSPAKIELSTMPPSLRSALPVP